MNRISGVVGAILLWCGLCAFPVQAALPEVLSQFNFQIVGLGLKAAPEYQAVPKGIATQVTTGFDAGELDIAAIIAQLPADYTVRAELSGPAYPTPKTLVTRPGTPFDIPTLALLGKHTLSNIRLVDANGTILFGATPQAVIIETINDPLITEVTTRPLTLAELQERGVTFDSSNFSAYQFSAVIATGSGQIPINLPVLIPNSNDEYQPVELPPQTNIGLSTPPEIRMPDEETEEMSISGFMMEVEVKEGDPPSNYVLPPIPGVLVIPGNIGFLHQYFSALAIVSNGAPTGSNLTIRDVQARLLLPVGADLVAGSDAVPGDDPLRMAKSGSDYFPRSQTVVNAGPDGQYGTSDDVSLLVPAASGQADFTIEGMKEGMHQLSFEIVATLDGLPVGPVQLKGRAKGAVLVRNPDFRRLT